jgi:hypothetical protein
MNVSSLVDFVSSVALGELLQLGQQLGVFRLFAHLVVLVLVLLVLDSVGRVEDTVNLARAQLEALHRFDHLGLRFDFDTFRHFELNLILPLLGLSIELLLIVGLELFQPLAFT